MAPSIYEILQELNVENGSNYKMSVLQEYKANEILQRVLKMAYDTVEYNYYIRKIPQYSNVSSDLTLNDGLNFLEEVLNKRVLTGNAAISALVEILSNLSPENSNIIEKVIGRDLKINIGKTQINKVWKDLITKPVYMRCDVYSKKTSKNIKFPAIVQLKADGTYREFTVLNGVVSSRSRSGESYDYPIINETLKDFNDGVYTGELTVEGISERSKGNGLINSDNPPHEQIVLELWDYITFDEYKNAANKVKNTITYLDRFNALKKEVVKHKTERVKVIPYKIVDTLSEALEMTSEFMNNGFEGSILKDLNSVYRDGTSKEQLKLKLEIDLEVRLVAFQPGTKGTKREGKVGSLIFQNDEGTIKGRCSGFTDAELDAFTDADLQKIMTVQFNDLTKAEGNSHYALSHPRFICFRNDKDETDTLEKAFELRQMAMELK